MEAVFKIIVFLCFVTLYLIRCTLCSQQFEIVNNRFVLNGKPIQIVSGSIHYFRIHPGYWKDRLSRVKSVGLNAIQVYVPWNFHEQVPNEFLWEGWQDLIRFLTLAQQEGFLVLLRPGPYICAEWDNGGLPPWLLNPNVTGIDPSELVVRSHDHTYLKFVKRWWGELLPRLRPLMYYNDGPIVMVQIENEFGSVQKHDRKYLYVLVNLARKFLGEDVVLYTTDQPSNLHTGTLQGGAVLSAVDFGPGWIEPNIAFALAQKYNPPGKSPPICTEFYTGWLTHWGEPMANTSAADLARSTLDVLNTRNGTGNINFYMVHGGTSFGFWAGANLSPQFQPDITSYDYDGIIAEGGGQGQPGTGGKNKYLAIREVLGAESIPEMAPPKTKAYGTVEFQQMVPLVDIIQNVSTVQEGIRSEEPLHMERYGQYYGLICYRTALMYDEICSSGLANLTFTPHDYAVVLVNGIRIGHQWVNSQTRTTDISSLCEYSSKHKAYQRKALQVDIVVEAMGRNNYYKTNITANLKGLIGPVYLNSNIKVGNWTVFNLPLSNDLGPIIAGCFETKTSDPIQHKVPIFLKGSFNISQNEEIVDTYVNVAKWNKGIVWINGFNLGRYWSHLGPQYTLYVPKYVLKKGVNEIIVLELSHVYEQLSIDLVEEPSFFREQPAER
eukprot:TRINITY_DN7700_c2_g1_i1.p1 TRINITY_DN7700_c2_g1~~TRINITY_DN7700_c2_g1_i1.p1  ORF type:complete len:665 (+),score=51.01 TRINITY_DN7700_c2_g1_i1:194-2188(+)